VLKGSIGVVVGEGGTHEYTLPVSSDAHGDTGSMFLHALVRTGAIGEGRRFAGL